jgi:arsenite methyltransferase
MTATDAIHDDVRAYYGEVLASSSDLKTGACCSTQAAPPAIRRILREIEPEVIRRFYGCGSPIPPAITGRTVLDLGCGTGRDAFVCAKLVGPAGRVIGVDMTDSQLAVARDCTTAQMQRFGFSESNVAFVHGYIEDLAAAGIADNSVDVVISNCVINLAPDKRRVFAEIWRVLKPGGELYFSDVFADRRIPETLTADPVLRGECLGGALYVEDFRRMLRALGCPDFRVVADTPVELKDEAIAAKIGMVQFRSLTVRAFKLADLEDCCEDYGQVATYRGTIPDAPHAFTLDDHHVFQTGQPVRVCGNTAAMVQDTRLGEHFVVSGDRSRHFGLFECAERISSPPAANAPCC